MRLLLKITLSLFCLISLMMGLRFIVGRPSTTDDPWLVVVPLLVGPISRVSQLGEVTPLYTTHGQAIKEEFIDFKDGWLWFYYRPPNSGDLNIYRIRLDGTLMEQITHQWMREEFIGFSGNSQWLIFTGDEFDRDIYRVRVNGSWPHRLVGLPEHEWPIGFSADGDWLLFLNGYYARDLWRVNTNTGEMQQLTRNLHIESVELSPNREWVFVGFKDYDHLNKPADLARLRVDGTGFQQLTFTRSLRQFGISRYQPQALSQVYQSTPSLVSPDGKWLLLDMIAFYSTDSRHLTMRADGQMLHSLPIEGRIVGWSADSEWIYYEYIPHIDYYQHIEGRPRIFFRIRRDGSSREVLSPQAFRGGGKLAEDRKWIFVGVWDFPYKCGCYQEYYGIATDGSGKWRVGGQLVHVLQGRLSLDQQWYYYLTLTRDHYYVDLHRIRVGVEEPPEKLARFPLNTYGDIDMLGWFESPNKEWSPLLIFGVAVGMTGMAAFVAWKRVG